MLPLCHWAMALMSTFLRNTTAAAADPCMCTLCTSLQRAAGPTRSGAERQPSFHALNSGCAVAAACMPMLAAAQPSHVCSETAVRLAVARGHKSLRATAGTRVRKLCRDSLVQLRALTEGQMRVPLQAVILCICTMMVTFSCASAKGAMAGAETVPGDSSRATVAIPSPETLPQGKRVFFANHSPPVIEVSLRNLLLWLYARELSICTM